MYVWCLNISTVSPLIVLLWWWFSFLPGNALEDKNIKKITTLFHPLTQLCVTVYAWPCLGGCEQCFAIAIVFIFQSPANTFSTFLVGLPVQILHLLTSPALIKQICLSLLHLPVWFLLSHQSKNCRGNNERITRPWRQGKKDAVMRQTKKEKKNHENSKIDMLETLWVKASKGTAIRTARQRKCQKKKWLAAGAQLECHYGIAVMTYYTPLIQPATLHRLKRSRHLFHVLFRLWIQTMDQNKGCVGETYYSEGWRVAKIRRLPSGPEKTANTGLIISLLFSCACISRGFISSIY